MAISRPAHNLFVSISISSLSLFIYSAPLWFFSSGRFWHRTLLVPFRIQFVASVFWRSIARINCSCLQVRWTNFERSCTLSTSLAELFWPNLPVPSFSWYVSAFFHTLFIDCCHVFSSIFHFLLLNCEMCFSCSIMIPSSHFAVPRFSATRMPIFSAI